MGLCLDRNRILMGDNTGLILLIYQMIMVGYIPIAVCKTTGSISFRKVAQEQMT